MKAFWKADWAVGLIMSLAFLFFSGSNLLQSLERKAYDLAAATSSKTPSDRIAIIAIDNESIANIGRWPWSREVHAKMVDILTGARAKVIGSTVLFIEPQIDPGLVYINRLLDLVHSTAANPASRELAMPTGT